MSIKDERDVLGILLLCPEQFPQTLATGLQASHFSVPEYGKLWDMMVDRWKAGRPLERGSFMDSVGQNYLFHMIDVEGALISNAWESARLVIHDQKREQVASKLVDFTARLRHETCDTDEMIERVCIEAHAFLEQKVQPSPRAFDQSRLSSVYLQTMERIGEAVDQRASGEKPGIPTGLPTLDSALGGGWQKKSSTVIAALSGKGKTHYGVFFAFGAAQAGFRVAYLSVEMDPVQIMTRGLAFLTGINSKLINSGNLSEPELDRLFDVQKELERYRIDIVNDFGDSSDAMLSRAKALLKDQERGKVDLFIVDYVQQLRPSKRYGTRTDELYALTHDIQQFALKNETAVIQLAQLNGRTYELAGQGLPPDSKCIEHCHGIYQNGETVLFHYEPAKSETDALYIAKNRYGEDSFDFPVSIDMAISNVMEIDSDAGTKKPA